MTYSQLIVANCFRAFRIMDDDSNKKLDMYEFKKGISDYGLILEEVVCIFNISDSNVTLSV